MARHEVIGDATLYLGDAREIVPTIEVVDMIFTDPPYGHNNNNDDDLIHAREAALGKSHAGDVPAESRPIANDGPEANDLARWLFQESRRVLRKGGCCCCCCCCGGPDPQFARWSLWMDEELSFKQMVIFDKGPMGMGWHYRRSYETVLVGMKPGAACRWFDDSGRIENIIRPGAYGIRKIIPQSDDHPTPKPPELAMHFMRLHSEVGDVVLDPFMGGGSTGVAALRMDRKFVGIEIDERFFDLSRRRIEEQYKSPRLPFDQAARTSTQTEIFA